MYLTIDLYISKKTSMYYKMNHDDEDWKKQIEKFKVVQKCPKCGELALNYVGGKIKCSKCSYEQNMKNI